MISRHMEDFFNQFDEFATWSAPKQTDYMVYYLIKHKGHTGITAKAISELATKLDLKPYSRLAPYLSESSKNKKGRYVKVRDGGYRLDRATFAAIDKEISNEPSKIMVSTQLTGLVSKVTNPDEHSFLIEAINCYRVQANRAAIILIWIIAIHHLQTFIFKNNLADFNTAFAKNPDRKLKKIVNYDDFSDLSESKLIELARSAGVISNDVRKLLDEKLGTRNSAAHPSAISISTHKATEFGLDLISNVILKY